MKRIVFLILSLISLIACQNQDLEYENYDYSTAFFPYQYPVRTLVLGNYIYNNTNDNNHKFLISAAIGGLYSNNSDRTVNFVLDESLCKNALFENTNDTVRLMPSNYYKLSSPNQIVIPSGKYNGSVEIQLNDEFFQDSLAIKLGYVIPLRITGSNGVDSILQGKTNSLLNVDPRDKSSWEVLPKNYTMFAVKYINEYHGSYLHYGENKVKDLTGNIIEENVYSEKHIEKNPTVKLITSGRYQVTMTTFLKSQVMNGEFELILDFTGDNCTITTPIDSDFIISGNGVFKHDKYVWGNKERDGIELNYSITKGNYIYEAKDVLIIRDRGVVMELFSPVLF